MNLNHDAAFNTLGDKTTVTNESPSKEALPVKENWDEDNKNPYNWSMAKRVYHTVLIGLFGLTV